MPELSHAAVHQFWKNYQDPAIYRVISFMEGVESWTYDNEPALEKALKELGKMLDNIENIELQQEEGVVELVTHIKTGRGLRLLMCLDNAHPGAAAKVLMYAEEHTQSDRDNCGVFLRRNIVFERLRLLSRVFAPDRLKLVLKALEDRNYA
jgi:intracellular multiplication protein IcmW